LVRVGAGLAGRWLCLIRSAGFREASIHEKHGRLGGAWRDAVIVELLIPPNVRGE
jgi:hypothetical protein